MNLESPPEKTVIKSKISGHVLSTSGAMLRGVRVTCNGTETKTLADGFFVLGGLHPGTYEVTVSLQRFKSASKTVSVQEGKDESLSFRLAEATENAKICGHVYDAESKKSIEHDGRVILILPVSNKYKAIKNGYYEFDNLSAGTYKLYTSISGYEDCDATVTVADGETKNFDLFCKTKRTEEPPWG
ncbi:carboxypeptidase regulatory-like domain-containing protein [Candidatus Bathyarchaeota archaeon]|nr:carboxypeptidase regulatory-like domain-containing protein [Candidatus Bathyarchaeota archaeon]